MNPDDYEFSPAFYELSPGAQRAIRQRVEQGRPEFVEDADELDEYARLLTPIPKADVA